MVPPIPMGWLKLRRSDRRQVSYRAIKVEHLVGADHAVRAIWELSGQLDLSRFAVELRTQRELGARAARGPRLLPAIWIWWYSEGVNHHTLSDFRVSHAEALEQVFTQVLAVLSQAELIDLHQAAAVCWEN